MTSASADGRTQLESSTSLSGVQTVGAPSEPLASQPPHGFGTVAITSDPEDAEIYVDEKFVGNAPAKLKLAAGSHNMVIKAAGFAEWRRTVEILKDSQVTLKPVLDRCSDASEFEKPQKRRAPCGIPSNEINRIYC
jgi:hypothetical protein